MTPFEEFVRARWGEVKPLQREWLIAVMGLGGEVSEVVQEWAAVTNLAQSVGRVTEPMKKHFRDGKHPGFDLAYEMGDVLHYLTVLAQSYGWTLDDLMEANMQKLNARDAARRAAGAAPLNARP